MEFIRSLLSWHNLLALCIGFIGIGIMIMVHELGHMLAARICGVKVESLSVGMGPVIASWTKGETKYCIRLILFGGACKMAGGDDLRAAIRNKSEKLDKCEDGSIYSVSPLKRLAIYLSGPLANIAFAVFCYFLLLVMPSVHEFSEPRIVLATDYPTLYENASPAASEAGLETGDLVLAINGNPIASYGELELTLASLSASDRVSIETERGTFVVKPVNGLFGILPYSSTVVGRVDFSSNESSAGLQHGDVIVAVNGMDVGNMFDILAETSQTDDITFTVSRNGRNIKVHFIQDDEELHFKLMEETVKVKGQTLGKALWTAFGECFRGIGTAWRSVGVIFERPDSKDSEISGSIGASKNLGILTTTGFSAGFNSGIRVVLYLLAGVSISLSVANMLPIPSLDGGLMLICIYEIVTRKQLKPKSYIILQTIGISMVLLSIVLITVL